MEKRIVYIIKSILLFGLRKEFKSIYSLTPFLCLLDKRRWNPGGVGKTVTKIVQGNVKGPE